MTLKPPCFLSVLCVSVVSPTLLLLIFKLNHYFLPGCGATPTHTHRETVMDRDREEDERIYKVVVNGEDQYSIWPADRENPLGWNDVGKTGTKAECLAYIKDVWEDMRPLPLRKRMEDEDKV